MKPIETVKYRDQRFLIQACRTGTVAKSAIGAVLVDNNQVVDGKLMAVYDFYFPQPSTKLKFWNEII